MDCPIHKLYPLQVIMNELNLFHEFFWIAKNKQREASMKRNIFNIRGDILSVTLFSLSEFLYPLNFFYKDISERGWGYKYISLYHVLYRRDLPGLNADQEQTFTSSVLSSNSTCTKAFAFWPVPDKGKLKSFPCTKKKPTR